MFRLYIADSSGEYQSILQNKEIYKILEIMDYCIIQKRYKTKYMVVQNINGGDDVIYFSYDNINKYLEFKSRYTYRKVKVKK